MLATLILLLVVRSSEIPFTQRQQQRATRIILLMGVCGLMLVSGGVGWVHSTAVPAPVQATPHLTPPVVATPSAYSTPTTPAYPTPTPWPTLTASAIEVLNTLCGAINSHDTAAILQQYIPSLQHTALTNRTTVPKNEQVKFIQCQGSHPNEQLPVDMLLLQTEDGNGFTDGYARPYQFLMDSSQGGWKVRSINYCLSDGCLPLAGRITQW